MTATQHRGLMTLNETNLNPGEKRRWEMTASSGDENYDVRLIVNEGRYGGCFLGSWSTNDPLGTEAKTFNLSIEQMRSMAHALTAEADRQEAEWAAAQAKVTA